jgi:hypothetical protein
MTGPGDFFMVVTGALNKLNLGLFKTKSPCLKTGAYAHDLNLPGIFTN